MTPDSRVYDAVLVHGYRFPYRGPGSDLGRRNTLQAAAAAHLHHQESAGQIIVVGGHWFGHKAPPFAEIFAKELTRRGVTDISPINRGRSTSAELDIFLSSTAKNGWSSVGSLVTRDHQERQEILKGRRSTAIASLVAEDVLDNALREDGLLPDDRSEAEALVAFFANLNNTAGFREKERILVSATQLRLDRALSLVGGLPGVRQLQNNIDG